MCHVHRVSILSRIASLSSHRSHRIAMSTECPFSLASPYSHAGLSSHRSILLRRSFVLLIPCFMCSEAQVLTSAPLGIVLKRFCHYCNQGMHAADAAGGGVQPPVDGICEEVGCHRQSTVECAYCDKNLCFGGVCAVWFTLNGRPSPLCLDCADDEDEEGDYQRRPPPQINEIRLDSLSQWRRDDQALHMLVTVEGIGPAPLPIRVHFNTEWSRLLLEVSRRTGIPRDRFELTFNGQQRHEDESMITSGCRNGDVVRGRFLVVAGSWRFLWFDGGLRECFQHARVCGVDEEQLLRES